MPVLELDAARLVGGSEADRSRVLERVHEYLEANASFDWGRLQDIWSGAPEAVFFNLNGHTYHPTLIAQEAAGSDSASAPGSPNASRNSARDIARSPRWPMRCKSSAGCCGTRP